MARKAVDSNEFEWKEDRLYHMPTGASFRWAHPNSDSQDVWVNFAKAHHSLPDGTRYDPGEIVNKAYEILQLGRKEK
jgi:hypothetical protein